MSVKKHLLYVTGLVLATVGPVSMFSATDLMTGVKKKLSANDKPAAEKTLPRAGSSPKLEIAKAALPGESAAPPLLQETLPSPSLEEVLRFDATVEWIMQRWPRVTTGLCYLQLQGYRVPLVTGTGLHDVAGSLTYYFNAGQQVQRITIRGSTGDPGALTSLLSARHHFVRRLTNDPSIVLYEAVDSDSRPVGSLKIRAANVIQSNRPLTRFEIDLVMDRAS